MVRTYLVFFVVVDEGEGQGDVERVGFVWGGGALPRLEGDHQVDVARRTVRLKRVDEILSEYRDEQLLELHVHAWKTTI